VKKKWRKSKVNPLPIWQKRNLTTWANNSVRRDLTLPSSLRLNCYQLKFCLAIALSKRLNFGYLWTVLIPLQGITSASSKNVRKSKVRPKLHVCLGWIVRRKLGYSPSVWSNTKNQNLDAKCQSLSISLACIGLLSMQMKRCLWQIKMWT